jgi:hypothetical protein
MGGKKETMSGETSNYHTQLRYTYVLWLYSKWIISNEAIYIEPMMRDCFLFWGIVRADRDQWRCGGTVGC